jgi:hypothetical protein
MSGSYVQTFGDFGRAWKLRIGCELMLNADYPPADLLALARSQPKGKDGFPEAAAVIRRRFPYFKVSLGETKPPLVLIEDTRIQQSVLHRPVDLNAFTGDMNGLMRVLNTQQVFLRWPVMFVVGEQNLFGPTQWHRAVRIPAMRSTVGDCLVTALLAKPLDYGLAFCLVSSPNGTRPLVTQQVVNEKLQTVKQPVDALLYVQPGPETVREQKWPESK